MVLERPDEHYGFEECGAIRRLTPKAPASKKVRRKMRQLYKQYMKRRAQRAAQEAFDRLREEE